MEDAIKYGIVLLLIVTAFWAVFRDHQRKRSRTVEEFEREVARAPKAMLRGIALDLEQMLTNEKRGAIEYTEDEKRGMTRTGSKGDEEGRTSPGADAAASDVR